VLFVKELETMQKYQVNQYMNENIIAFVKSREAAIPEIQRPFVWNHRKNQRSAG